MASKRHTAEQIINKLREVEILVSQGSSVRDAIRQIEVSEQTYYRWRKEYGGMDITQAHRLKELQKENQRLKHIVADLTIDNSILKETVEGKF
jgi:putative transposase